MNHQRILAEEENPIGQVAGCLEDQCPNREDKKSPPLTLEERPANDEKAGKAINGDERIQQCREPVDHRQSSTLDAGNLVRSEPHD